MVGLEIAIFVLVAASVCLNILILLSLNEKKKERPVTNLSKNNITADQSNSHKQDEEETDEIKYRTPYDLASAILDGSEDIDNALKEK